LRVPVSTRPLEANRFTVICEKSLFMRTVKVEPATNRISASGPSTTVAAWRMKPFSIFHRGASPHAKMIVACLASICSTMRTDSRIPLHLPAHLPENAASSGHLPAY